MADIHVNYDNIKALLIGITNNLKRSIDAIDLTEEQKAIIIKAGKLKIDGDGNSYLADNGEYKPINLQEIEYIYTKISDIYNLFKIEAVIDETWHSAKPMVIPRDAPSSCIYNNEIYIFGGVPNDSGTSPINKVEIYNIETDTWRYGIDIPNPAGWMSTIIHNKKIYCIGGHSSNLNRIYDLDTNTWSTGTNLSSSKHGFACELYDEKIYCIGGYNTQANPSTSIVEIYDIKSNVWSTGVSMPTARVALDSVLYNGKIYCIGGFSTIPNYLNKVEIYDIKLNIWTTSKDMTTARRGLQCQLYDDNIYCIGGTNTNVLNIVEVYDIKSDIWKTSTPMDSPKYAFTSQLVNNKIYCIGGFNNISAFNNMDIFNLKYLSYEIDLPTEIQAKIDIIKNDGDGTKLLSDNGNYIEYNPGYRELNTEELNTIVNEIKLILGGN